MPKQNTSLKQWGWPSSKLHLLDPLCRRPEQLRLGVIGDPNIALY
jgi:hypothetical protein